MLHKKKETEVFYFYGHRKVTVNKTPIHSDLWAKTPIIMLKMPSFSQTQVTHSETLTHNVTTILITSKP